MFRSSIVALAVLGCASIAFAADKHVSKEGRYAVGFPAKPMEKTTEVEAPAPIGKITLYISSLDVKKDVAFMVIYNDYPEVVAKADPQKVLAAVRKQSIGAGMVVADISTIDANPPAREFIIEKEGGFYRARVILAGTRLYQIVVVAKNNDLVTAKPADEFIKSFEIKE